MLQDVAWQLEMLQNLVPVRILQDAWLGVLQTVVWLYVCIARSVDVGIAGGATEGVASCCEAMDIARFVGSNVAGCTVGGIAR